MSEQIKVGDLVMVVRGLPCCGACLYGRAFVVEEIAMSTYNCPCEACGQMVQNTLSAITIDSGRSRGFALNRLKRIDPPAIPESLPASLETHVTADE